jgi:hypothetical protein
MYSEVIRDSRVVHKQLQANDENELDRVARSFTQHTGAQQGNPIENIVRVLVGITHVLFMGKKNNSSPLKNAILADFLYFVIYFLPLQRNVKMCKRRRSQSGRTRIWPE